MPASSAPTTSSTSASGPRSTAVFRCDGARIANSEKVTIEAVDFRNPTFLAEGELRRLRSVHQDYLRTLSSRLSGLLRSEVALNLGKFGTESCADFLGGLKSPSQISLFRVTPLNGVGFIEISAKLAVALTNRILGGREPAANPDSILTEIEIALLEDVIAIITSEWCELWCEQTAMHAHLIGHETNPRFIQTTEKNAVMLVVGIEVAFGRCEEIIQIAVPLSMIEPMMKRMSAARARESGPQNTERNAAWKSNYDDIAVPLRVELTAARMTLAALLNLKKGDVIELSAAVLESARINVAGAIRFTARAGQQDGHAAVQIIDKIQKPKK